MQDNNVTRLDNNIFLYLLSIFSHRDSFNDNMTFRIFDINGIDKNVTRTTLKYTAKEHNML